jgi:hypothetical protein
MDKKEALEFITNQEDWIGTDEQNEKIAEWLAAADRGKFHDKAGAFNTEKLQKTAAEIMLFFYGYIGNDPSLRQDLKKTGELTEDQAEDIYILATDLAAKLIKIDEGL